MEISEDVKLVRSKLGISQSKFAELFNELEPSYLELSREDVSKYENGVTLPPADKYKKILSMLRFSK